MDACWPTVRLTRCLNTARSDCVNVSAFAITGIKLTRVPRRFIISMSRGLRLHTRHQWIGGEMCYACVRVSSGPDEKQAGMYAEITFLRALWLLLLPHVNLVLIIDEVNDGGPRVTVVDVVAESRGVNHGKLDFERFLLQFSFDDVHLSSWRQMSWRSYEVATRTSVNLSSCLMWRRW